MKILQKKSKIATIALILLLTFSATILAMPIVSAHDPPQEVPTFAYLSVEPNPIGVGQTATIIFWIDKLPATAAGTGGDRWQDITIEVTAPDGNKETIGPLTSDPIGGGWVLYTPDQVGTYTFVFDFPGQVLSLIGPTGLVGANSAYINDTFLASTATKIVNVQQDPIEVLLDTPVTDDYWTRPIEGQNTAWASMASNWLAGSQIIAKFQQNGIGPESAHVMWAKEFSFGGVVGGSFDIEGMTFYDGTNYESQFVNPLIISGRLYYPLPKGTRTSGGGYICVDLQTGETIWVQDYAANPSFGQLYDYESFNQHGVIPNGYLWASVGGGGFFGPPMPNNWTAYDPFSGEELFTITNVPTGTEVYSPNGEIMRYKIDIANNWLALWNSTAMPELAAGLTSSNAYQWRPIGKTVDAASGYQWNVTIPDLPAGSSIRKVIPGDMILGSTAVAGFLSFGTPDIINTWAISLKPESRGELLWTNEIAAPANDVTRTFAVTDPDPEVRVFTMFDKETISWVGFSLDDGSLLWTTESENPWNYYSGAGGALTTSTCAYGKLYSTGYSGTVYCYDLTDGTLLWEYKANAGFSTPYGAYPLGIAAVADGKLYLTTNEHSSGAPYWKGSKIRCIDANTGDEIWTLASHGTTSYGSNGYALADGYLTYLNLYDMQVYCIGKGPSATTVAAPMTAVTKGSSVMITGTVTDQSVGASGTPAMSDQSMGEWMEYLYMQKPMPDDAKGVTVKLTSIDPNGNYQEIGYATSDIAGKFGISWVPPVEGEYYVLAEFEGSNSYGSSYDTTYFVVDPAPSPAMTIEPEPAAPEPTQPEPTTPAPAEPKATESVQPAAAFAPAEPAPTEHESIEPSQAAEAPLVTTEVAIIAAVTVASIIGIVAFLALRKRK